MVYIKKKKTISNDLCKDTGSIHG